MSAAPAASEHTDATGPRRIDSGAARRCGRSVPVRNRRRCRCPVSGKSAFDSVAADGGANEISVTETGGTNQVVLRMRQIV